MLFPLCCDSQSQDFPPNKHQARLTPPNICWAPHEWTWTLCRRPRRVSPTVQHTSKGWVTNMHPSIHSLFPCPVRVYVVCWEVGGVRRGICRLVQSFMQQEEELRVWDRRVQSLWGEGIQQTPSQMLLMCGSGQQLLIDGSLAWKTRIASGWQCGSRLNLVQTFRCWHPNRAEGLSLPSVCGNRFASISVNLPQGRKLIWSDINSLTFGVFWNVLSFWAKTSARRRISMNPINIKSLSLPYSSNQISFSYTAQNHNHIASVGFTVCTVNDVLRPSIHVKKKKHHIEVPSNLLASCWALTFMFTGHNFL